jgi:hypothetical protein
VLGDPVVQCASWRQVRAARWALRDGVGELAEGRHDPVGRDVIQAEAAQAGSVDDPAAAALAASRLRL